MNKLFYNDNIDEKYIMDMHRESLDRLLRMEKDARRYRFLRERNIDAIRAGGIFAGMTPENIVINGDDLDREIDLRLLEQS